MISKLIIRSTYSTLTTLLSIGGLMACGVESLDHGEGDEADHAWDESAVVTQAAVDGTPYIDHIQTSRLAVAAGETKLLEATCPSGGLAVGGGARTTSFDFVILGSIRMGEDRWQVKLTNYGNDSSARVYVNCLMNADNATVEVVNKVKLIGPESGESLNATCPNPSQVIGGGFWLWGEPDVHPTQSYRLTSGTWTARGENKSTQNNATLGTQAICLSGLSFQTAESTRVIYIDAGQEGSARANCPDGYEITAGGFWIGRERSGTSTNDVMMFRNYSFLDSDLWYARGKNVDSGTLSLSVHALCTKIN